MKLLRKVNKSHKPCRANHIGIGLLSRHDMCQLADAKKIHRKGP
jgi:hypothetical protein